MWSQPPPIFFSRDCSNATVRRAHDDPHRKRTESGVSAAQIGRVGALAVALGIGTALAAAGSASADANGTEASRASSASVSSSTPAGESNAARRPAARDSRLAAREAKRELLAQSREERRASAVVDRSISASASTQPADSATPGPAALALTSLVSLSREPESSPGVPAASQAVALPSATAAASASQSAVVSQPEDITVEAESMTILPGGVGRTYRDKNASDRSALLLVRNGVSSTTLETPAFDGLVVRAMGTEYGGQPVMTVSIDGQAEYSTSVSSSWTDYAIPLSASAGIHTVSIAFTNDYRRRDLRLDQITVVAAIVPDDPQLPNPDPEPPASDPPPYFQKAGWLWDPIAADAETAADSATWVSYFSEPGEQHIANMYRFGVTLVSASDITESTPRYDVGFTKRWGSDPFGSATVAIPEGTRIPAGSDRHIAILDPATNQAYGIWQAKYDSATDTWSGSWGGATALDGDGIDQTGSATATGLARYAGVVTADEFSAAVEANTGINHALVFSTNIAGPDFVGPAIKSDGSNIAGVAVPIPQGYRVQLDPSIDVDAIPGITPGEKVIAKTLQTHGAYVGDQGGARMAFMFELLPDATSSNPGSVYVDAGLAWDYYDMQNIPWSQLRVLSSIEDVPDGGVDGGAVLV